MTWNLFANGDPTPADFPIIFGGYLNKKWCEHRAEEGPVNTSWHISWTHWISVAPPVPPKPTRAELDLEIGTKTARESGYYCVSNGNLAKLAAQCVKAGREDFKAAIYKIIGDHPEANHLDHYHAITKLLYDDKTIDWNIAK